MDEKADVISIGFDWYSTFPVLMTELQVIDGNMVSKGPNT